MNQASLELWEKSIDGRKSSGLNVNDWCEKNNLTKHAYYYLKKRIELFRNDKMNTNNTPVFAELKSAPKFTKKTQEALQISWNDLKFSISDTETAKLAAEFITQLQKRC